MLDCFVAHPFFIVKGRLIRYVLQKFCSKFLELENSASENFRVSLEGGEGFLTLKNVRLNAKALSKYTGPLMLREGTIEHVTVTLGVDEMGGNVQCDGVCLELASKHEEAMIFFDALTAGTIECGLGRVILEDLELESFQCDDMNGDSDSREEKSMEARTYDLGEFVFECTNVMIIMQGVQNYEKIMIGIPRIEIYKEFGRDSTIIELIDGASVEWVENEKSVPLGRLAHLIVNIDENSKCKVKAKNSCFTLDIALVGRLREMYREYYCNLKYEKESKMLGAKSEFEIYIREFELNIASNTFAIEEFCYSNGGEALMTSIRCLHDSQREWGRIERMDLLKKKKDISLQIMKAELRDTDLMNNELLKELQLSSLGNDRDATLWTRDPNDQYQITVKVDRFVASNLIIAKGTYYMDLEDVEFVSGMTRLALHASFIHMADESMAEIKLFKASIYRSFKSMIEHHTIYSPFQDLYINIEGREFVAVKSSPEEYFLMKSSLVDTFPEHWHLSADSLIISGDFVSLIRKAYHQRCLETTSPLEDATSAARRTCVTASFQNVKTNDTKLKLAMDCSGVEFLYSISDNLVLGDLRLDCHTLCVDGINLFKKVLTTSLDPHFKPCVLSFIQKDKLLEISFYLAGILITLPMFLEQAYEPLKDIFQFTKTHHVASEKSFARRIFIQLDLCTFETKLPPKYQNSITPHVIYLEGVKLILETKPWIAFLQNGEVLMAPGAGQTKPISGLFPEGHNYWAEQNYEPILNFDFIPLFIDKQVLKVENHELTLNIFRDSLNVIKKTLQAYLKLLQEQRAAFSSTDDEPDVTIDEESIMEGLAELSMKQEPRKNSMFFSLEEQQIELEQLIVDDDFCHVGPKSKDNSEEEEESDSVDLTHLIELPLYSDTGDDETEDYFFDTKEDNSVDEDFKGEESNQLTFDKDFFTPSKRNAFSMDENFPFRELLGLVSYKIRVYNFDIKVCLREGKQWHPARHNHVPVHTAHNHLSPTNPLSVDQSSIKSTASFHGASTSDHASQTPSGTIRHTRRSSTTASSCESRWSQLVNPPTSSDDNNRKTRFNPDDRADLVIRRMAAEIDISNPFPAELVPSLMVTAARILIEDVQVLDFVQSSKWKSFMTRTHDSHGPFIKIRVDSTFVPQGKTQLLPEEQMEYSIEIGAQPMRMHIDQDTLLFILQFLQDDRGERYKEKTNYESPNGIFIRNYLDHMYLFIYVILCRKVPSIIGYQYQG